MQIILLDSSGSMSGKEYQLAVATASAILDTLGDDDFFNLISFSDQSRVIVPCFQDKMVRYNFCKHSNDLYNATFYTTNSHSSRYEPRRTT